MRLSEFAGACLFIGVFAVAVILTSVWSWIVVWSVLSGF